MAIFHCNISVVSRADGGSAVAGAAYISRSKIECDRDGTAHDFTRAHQHEELVADLGVSLPEKAPERWRDRSVLWNEVERVEKKSDAQLARRIECALPDELPEAEQIALARQIVAERVDDGHVVDACIHRSRDGHNCHLHMQEPLRRCDGNGFLAKSENVYTVRNADGDERKVNAAGFKELKGQGYEKVFKYRRGNEWRQLTATEAGRVENEGFKRSGKTPVQETRYLNNGWNEKERAEEWRSQIATLTNAALERAELEARVDHRSYERQGVDKVPQIHEGSRVRRIEQREQERAQALGIEYSPVTDRARENVEIRRMNSLLAAMTEELRRLTAAVEQRARRTRRRVERFLAAQRSRAMMVAARSHRASSEVKVAFAADASVDEIMGTLVAEASNAERTGPAWKNDNTVGTIAQGATAQDFLRSLGGKSATEGREQGRHR